MSSGARPTQGPGMALQAQLDEAHADHKGHSRGAVGQAYFPVEDGEAGRRPALESELDSPTGRGTSHRAALVVGLMGTCWSWAPGARGAALSQ